MIGILNQLDCCKEITCNESFRVAKICSRLLRNSESELDGRRIIIHILDNWDKVCGDTKEIWSDLIEAAGFYPYIGKEEAIELKSTSAKIRTEFYKSLNLDGKYLHEEQKNILDIIKKRKNLIVSAPTSFGKSLLIEEIISSKQYNNVVIIQPTLALLDETRRKLKKYKNYYKIIVRTTQKQSLDKGNIFLLTAERVMEYKNLPKIDYFILDEFYKISAKRDDERSDALNNAINLLINKHKSKFYLLGPNIDGISPGFAERYNADFYKTNYSLVDTKSIDYYTEYKDLYGCRGRKKEFKEQKLFELLYELRNEQSIIYCSSPARVRYLSVKFKNYLKEKEIKESREEIYLIEWIEKNINKNWSLVECLKYGIGIHDGALQKHITSSIIKYFNSDKLKYLFCTSTIIEGVNTSSKNVIYFDQTKGRNIKIDHFDYSNIKGRAGRMMVHYIGKIYNFNPEPLIENVIIDIPFFDQNPVSDEVLINIDDKDIRDKNSKQYKELEGIPNDIKQLVQKNGVSIKGQLEIIRILRDDIENKYDLIAWSGFPRYQQLRYILGLAWDNLLKSGETTRPMTLNKLVKVTFDYGNDSNIIRLVKENFLYLKRNKKNKSDIELLDNAIQESFQILKHWFQYKVPKWLSVINDLQEFICNRNGMKSGSYMLYANQIENEFIRDNLSVLYEYGVPSSAIKKIEKKIPSDIDEDKVLDYIKSNELFNSPNLISYEKEKLYENI
ncbi:DEAD/DEAH box helicase family protein [Clostridium sporogenes]|uniref:DEAD/DEAH box helicase family protein n=1 Tax=Clostridium sporogenes TaxID=1509 RepID=A0A1L3ND54_CLOSG|nr:DEAD/DEAH box helicase [Clostridium sporogenes]APH14059.1 DEAD/DEAH box helicase family protein [Clostridium sporogenes]